MSGFKHPRIRTGRCPGPPPPPANVSLGWVRPRNLHFMYASLDSPCWKPLVVSSLLRTTSGRAEDRPTPPAPGLRLPPSLPLPALNVLNGLKSAHLGPLHTRPLRLPFFLRLFWLPHVHSPTPDVPLLVPVPPAPALCHTSHLSLPEHQADLPSFYFLVPVSTVSLLADTDTLRSNRADRDLSIFLLSPPHQERGLAASRNAMQYVLHE